MEIQQFVSGSACKFANLS